MSSRRRVILVGGGLANGLIAYRLAGTRGDVECVMVEPDTLGGNHTWCFHAGDLDPGQQRWMAPFVVRDWHGYDVRFPDRARRLDLRYACVTAERLRQVVEPALAQPVLRARAHGVDGRSVLLDDGRVLEGDLVLDGRGAGAMPDWALAWQAFLGLELRLAAPHRLTAPVIMDATVPQMRGFRFFYCLPLSEDVLLIEDTRYQDGARFDPAVLREAIQTYAESHGWRIAQVLREESGALPIVLSGRLAAPDSGAVPVGMRAGLFHPVTGYSLPDAVRMADLIATQPDLTTDALRPLVLATMRRQWRQHRFYRLLNRMLFMAGDPGERWRILSRFYALPEPLIARFYAGATTTADALRIVSGRPPVPIAAALACLPPSSARGFIGQARPA
jgi:lycopene beta-cyclase